MKTIPTASLLLVIVIAWTAAQGQTPQPSNPLPSPEPQPRANSSLPAPESPLPLKTQPTTEADALATPEGTIVGSKPENRPQVAGPAATERRADLASGSRVLSPPQIQARIAEAERLLKS